ncbi:MAG: single-stranded DNA-binding protein [Oscillospiraceae bacterium]|jgi:single-strand DNA-binding protein|nr:single-stranded DNA-binding protein [Oscillospiraceae bacterium]
MLNQIIVMGRLTRDPELRATQNGIPVASFTVACDRDFVGRDNGQRETDFIDCVSWRGQAEFVSKNFRKGDMIIVTGRLQIRDWTDKEGGKRRQAEIVAENIHWGETRQAKEARLNNTSNYSGSYGNSGGYSEPHGYDSGYTPPPQQSGFGESAAYPAYPQPQTPSYGASASETDQPANSEPSFVELDDPELPF